jgi:hypothetical protein
MSDKLPVYEVAFIEDVEIKFSKEHYFGKEYNFVVIDLPIKDIL